MEYGIYVTKEIFDVFEDGSEKLISTRTGWLNSNGYDMKSAKYRLKVAKESLNDGCYEVKVINSRTIKGVRVASYNGEQFAPVEVKEVVTYHIEKK